MIDIRKYLWKKKVLLIFNNKPISIEEHNNLISKGYIVLENPGNYKHLLPHNQSMGYISIGLDGLVESMGSDFRSLNLKL